MFAYQPDAHINDYIYIIKRRKNVFLTFFLLVVGIVTVVSFLTVPVYEARVTVLIDMESPNVLTTTGNAVAFGSTNYYAYKEYFESQKEIVQGREVIQQVFDEFKLEEHKDYRNSKEKLDKFSDKIKVEPVRNTRLLRLYVEDKNPQLAAQLANRIAEVYVQRNLLYITKSEVIELHKNEYLRLQRKLSEYSKVYKAKHPKMIRLREEIEQMARRIKDEEARATGTTAAEAGSTEFEREASGSLLAGLKANNISILERAEVPEKPSKPQKRLNVLLAMIVGFFGGTGLVFFLEYLDDTIKDIEDVEKVVKWPFLGYIPNINEDADLAGAQKDIIVHTNSREPVAEAYKAIRTSLLFSSIEARPSRSLLFTSAGPEEGKTMTISNIAIALAHNGNRTLIVDADMRKSRQHAIFKKKNDVGFSNFLSGQAKFAEVIKETDIENLSLVCAGPHPPNPSELLMTHKTREFIDQLKTKFDFVLFDTAPLAVVTDAVILSQAVDGTVIVIESGKTGRKVLPRIDQILRDAQVKVVGFILNKIHVVRGSDYYSYQYSYYGKHTK